MNKKIEILQSVEIVKDNYDEIPFPQANSFDVVIKTFELIYSDVNTSLLISQCLGFAEREAKYYIDALRYLGLVEKSNNDLRYFLTDDGFITYANFDQDRNIKFISRILRHNIFNVIYKETLKENQIPSIDHICTLMKEFDIDLSDDTLKRRASTVKGWIQWIIDCNIS